MKRQAEEEDLCTMPIPLLTQNGHINKSPIHRSPMKLLNTINRLKRRREESIGYTSSDEGSSPLPQDSTSESETEKSETGPLNGPETGPLPIANGHGGFPCVWLNGNTSPAPVSVRPVEDPEAGRNMSPKPGMSPPQPSTIQNGHIYPETETDTYVPPTKTPPPPALDPVEEAKTEKSGHGGQAAFPCMWMNGNNSDAPVAVKQQEEANPNASPKPGLSPPQPPQPSLVTQNGHMTQTRPPNLPHPHPPRLSDLTDITRTMTSETGEPITVEVCPECNKVFKRKVYLQRHMEREHWSTAKVFKCDDCSYETKHQSNLSVHRRIHTGERPYHCGACGQRYTQGHLLKSHIRSRHGGNMEFYNLDKKSDSTRGRKSLDAKHEVGGHHHKQEKINTLVQQLEQQKLNQIMQPNMTQFMSTMSPYINTLRPLMASPLALTASSLLGGPRLFSIGGIGNTMASTTMLPAVHHGLPLLGGHSNMAQVSNMQETGIKIPLKVPDIPAQTETSQNQSLRIKEIVEEPGPEDLTTKKSPPKELELNHLKSPNTHHRERDNFPSPLHFDDPHRIKANINHISMPTIEDKENFNDHLPIIEDKENFGDHICDDDCPHAKKLRELRKNIVRMLSVLTPDLSIENGLDYNTDQVDELLHEVIYSNMDDVSDDDLNKT